MNTEQDSADNAERAGCAAAAALPRLPCLKADNCIGTHGRKQLFVAQENIRLYIEKFGGNNVGVLTITTPSECLSARAFQEKWHPFRTNVVSRMFPTGMWVRERQPRTGNWHAHAIVNLGWDIRTAFPFDQVRCGFYANVDPGLRAVWKKLRAKAERYNFGRTELLPIKSNGEGFSFYVTKYLGKALVSNKSEGEEKCRLFGIWGGVRFVYSKFDWVSNRILRKRKAWLAADSGLQSEEEFRRMFGAGWWHFLGHELMNVVMPVEYYQIRRNGELVFDELGWWHYQTDLQRFDGIESEEDRMTHSRFLLYCAHGMMLYGNRVQALRYAMRRIGFEIKEAPPVDPQLFLDLEAAIERTRKTVPA
jgi:hypothetical protein